MTKSQSCHGRKASATNVTHTHLQCYVGINQQSGGNKLSIVVPQNQAKATPIEYSVFSSGLFGKARQYTTHARSAL